MIAFIDQEADEKVDEIRAKVWCYEKLILVFFGLDRFWDEKSYSNFLG